MPNYRMLAHHSKISQERRNIGESVLTDPKNIWVRYMGIWMIKCFKTNPSVGDNVTVQKRNGILSVETIKAIVHSEPDILICKGR